jgi:hypothetical protein
VICLPVSCSTCLIPPAHYIIASTRITLFSSEPPFQPANHQPASFSTCPGEFEALTEVLGEADGSAPGSGGQRDVVAGLLARITSLQAAAAAAEATRRSLHNELVALRGNVRACVWWAER